MNERSECKPGRAQPSRNERSECKPGRAQPSMNVRPLRYSNWDAVLVALSMAHAAVVFLSPSIAVIAIGMWWNSNTISHNFIHNPFFHSGRLNRGYSFYLSLLLGFPQRLWRDRHLAHHQGRRYRFRLTAPVVAEIGSILLMWGVMAWAAPQFLAAVYLPGYVIGLTLCYLHGYFEHAHGVTSHYGLLYNLSFFNDGYHVEHHMRPAEHWTRLPEHISANSKQSRWPAVLRWIEVVNLELLEGFVLRSRTLQRFVLSRHERAFRRIFAKLENIRSVKIVGGGLFPRTALVLQRLLPGVTITIVDASSENIATAKRFIGDTVTFVQAMYKPGSVDDADVVIIPLAFRGDRRALYANPPARWTLIHDWIWSRRGEGVTISVVLLKRLNLVSS